MCNALLTELGVRDAPDHDDAIAVIREISDESKGEMVSNDAFAVLMASWGLLEKALDDGSVPPQDVFANLSSVPCVANAYRFLMPPTSIFFENRAGLAGKFGEFLARNVIERPLVVGGALEAAGVRRLGSAVEVELLECVDPIDDARLTDRITSRRSAIGRVLISHASGQKTQASLARLDGIQCRSSA